MATPVVFRSPASAPGDRGRRLGAAFPERIRHAADFYDRLFAASGIAPRDAAALALEAFDHVAAWSPAQAEEMEGIARGSGLPLGRIAALNARTEILGRFGEQHPECSTLVHLPADGAPPATAQTWDWHDGMRDGWFVWSVEHPGGRTVHMVTEYGIVGKIGVNSDGLGLHFNILGHTADRTAPAAGPWVPVHVAARHVLDTCTTVAEAAELAASIPVAASGSFTLAGHTRGRADAEAVELSPAGAVRHRPRADGHLVRTNHFVDPGLAGGEAFGAADPGTYQRMKVLRERTAEAGPADRADLLDALACHPEHGAEVCCHAAPEAELGKRWETLATVVLDVARGSLAAHAGGPCTRHPGSWAEAR
ncbi:C45 family autoproteolytic acyltransferase/hydolase [Nocardiopsis composta]|uniref:Isopenicillin-N N-acyltransferase-like protein n=1 Tax=Nocardiopsis composta TaxID=157465 RepID=A0A7W8QIV1_9ACTN|nr:C45 family peptidase [Nocardiopsis composta]MBB5431105.1 isopenicillin-N N-acyltransferase-like protein [Nocardiopsis composta]